LIGSKQDIHWKETLCKLASMKSVFQYNFNFDENETAKADKERYVNLFSDQSLWLASVQQGLFYAENHSNIIPDPTILHICSIVTVSLRLL
jgi:hypothetical protein